MRMQGISSSICCLLYDFDSHFYRWSLTQRDGIGYLVKQSILQSETVWIGSPVWLRYVPILLQQKLWNVLLFCIVWQDDNFRWIMDHSAYGLGLSQWEEVLLCNAFSHWPSPYPEWSLWIWKSPPITHWDWDKTLMCFDWNFTDCFFPLGQIDNGTPLVYIMAWRLTTISHYLNLCWPRCLMPYGIDKPQ